MCWSFLSWMCLPNNTLAINLLPLCVIWKVCLFMEMSSCQSLGRCSDQWKWGGTLCSGVVYVFGNLVFGCEIFLFGIHFLKKNKNCIDSQLWEKIILKEFFKNFSVFLVIFYKIFCPISLYYYACLICTSLFLRHTPFYHTKQKKLLTNLE